MFLESIGKEKRKGYFLYGTQTLFSFGIGIASPSIRGIISSSVPDDQQGKVSGGTLSLGSLTQIFGPLLAGWSYDTFTPITPMLVGACLAAFSVVALLTAQQQKLSAV